MLKISHPKINTNNIAKKAILAGTLVTGMLVAGCKQKNTIEEDTKAFLVETLDNRPLDFSKPNLPIITDNSIIYKNCEGVVNNINLSTVKSDCALALYKAIKENSTNEKPDIENIEEFYIDTQKNIPRGISNIMGSATTASAIKYQHSSDLFDKMFDMFTNPESDKGKTISVKEYTQMMEAWSSTKPR